MFICENVTDEGDVEGEKSEDDKKSFIKIPKTLKRDLYFFDITKKIAESQNDRFGYKFAAMIVHRHKVISVGTNLEKTHPFAARFGRNQDSTFWHAETHAIYNAYKNGIDDSIFSKSTMYVVRLKLKNNKGQKHQILGLSKPCKGCMNCINFFGIKKIVYSIDQDKYGYGFDIIECK
ncbi:MAG: hypothetical protein NZZ41_00060 [Candidatus Dojkabacteria bacterium]|nr:hypothetical protein [Candidatus Dojkabacteria bacterium]